jgi:hypothetical protein
VAIVTRTAVARHGTPHPGAKISDPPECERKDNVKQLSIETKSAKFSDRCGFDTE